MACMRRKFPLEELAAAHEKTPCKDGETEPSRQRTGQALNPKEGLHLQHLQQGLWSCSMVSKRDDGGDGGRKGNRGPGQAGQHAPHSRIVVYSKCFGSRWRVLSSDLIAFQKAQPVSCVESGLDSARTGSKGTNRRLLCSFRCRIVWTRLVAWWGWPDPGALRRHNWACPLPVSQLSYF